MKNEQQVSIVLYSDDIPKYKNLFLLFHTYLVSCAKVRDPRGYSIRAGTYEWVADKYTIVEPITDNDGLEAPLAALEKLSPLPFSAIEQQHPGAEFDLLAVVVNCSALQYTADQSKHFREAIVMDQRQGEADRTNVVVLYFRSSSSSTSSLNLAPIEDQVQSISTIPQSLSTVQTVPVEGRISLPDHSQSFYLLACSNCNHYLLPIKTNSDLCRVHITNDTTKPVCMMCHFNIDITDSNGTITATVSEALAERIPSLTVDQIYDKVVVQVYEEVMEFN
ncbi:replication protein A 70 kDa DNA-binding subunit B [Capsicum galapagoense]